MNNKQILILKALALNFPILRSRGYVFPRVITVVVETGMQAKAMNALANFSINNEGSRNSDFLFYYIGKNKIRDEEMRSIREKHLFDAKGKCGLPLIITENLILEDEKRNQFFVFLENMTEIETFMASDLVPLTEDLELIYTKLSEIENSAITEEEKILKATVCFLEPYCFRNNNMKLIAELLEVSEKMCILDEEARDTRGLEEIFIKTLYEWQRDSNFSNIFELRKMPFADVDVQDVLFHDAQYVYMSEKMFKNIVEPMREFIPINALKKGLVETGVIDVSNKNAVTYTVKISIPVSENQHRRINMLRLNREKIEVFGDVGIVDACYFSKEDKW